MRKYVCICNTYSQLILSIHLKNTIFKNDEVCCVLSDHSNNSYKIYKNLLDQKVFNNVFYIESKFFDDTESKKNKILGLLYLLGFKPRFIRTFKIDSRIDEIIFYNRDYVAFSIFNVLYRKNKKILASRYDEGALSLNVIDDIYMLTIKQKCAYKIRSMLGLSNPVTNIGCLYSMFTNLYHGKLKTTAVPEISQLSDTSNALKKIFSIDELTLEYPYKYIFFTSVYDFEGGKPVGEYELVCKIADLVGKENLLVKTHPRDTRTIYKDNGFNVDKNSAIPWEAIQLSGDFSNQVCMTINSGSVLSGSTMSEKPVRTYYMYKLCDISGNDSCKKNADDIEALLSNDEMKEVLRTVKIAERIEDIL